MVLKKSKFGLNSGNTLRRNRYVGYKSTLIPGNNILKGRDGMRDDLIYKWSDDEFSNDDNDGLLNRSDNVMYSLNKGGRWSLPDNMNGILLESYQTRDLEYNSNIEKVPSVNFASENDVLNPEIQSNSYQNSVDIKSDQSSKSWNLLEVSSDFEESINQTNVKLTSGFAESRAKKKKYSSMKKLQGIYKHHNMTFLNHYEVDHDEVYDEDHQNDEDFVENEKKYTFHAISLDAYLTKKIKKSKNRNTSKSLVKRLEIPYYGKPNYKVMDDPDLFLEYSVQFSEKSNDKTSINYVNGIHDDIPLNRKCKQVECCVKGDYIESKYLLKQFGDQYIEGNCFPRQFIIINKNFSYKDTLMLVKVKANEPIVSTCNDDYFVIIIKLINVSNDLIECSKKLFEQDNNSDLNFQLLLKLCFPESCSDVIQISIGTKNHEARSSIKPVARIDKENDICQILFNQIQKRTHLMTTTNINTQDTLCPVCFEVNSWTCLTTCSHHVCDACWKLYVETKYKSGCYEIFCPYNDCNTNVDLPTVLGFIDFSLVSKFIEKSCELLVMRTKRMKFCPSPSCSIVAVDRNLSKTNLNSTPIPILDYRAAMRPRVPVLENNCSVDCPSCKMSWCFSCQQPEHWPSSCKANKTYQKSRLEKDYDSLFDMNGNMNEIIAECKRCPSCRCVISKVGGCNDIKCRCGFLFCWICLKTHNKKNPYRSCTSIIEKRSMFTVVDFLGRRYKINRLLENAIYCRMQRRKITNIQKKLKISTCSSKEYDNQFFIKMSSEAMYILMTGYRLLENLSASAISCKSKDQFRKIMNFIHTSKISLQILLELVDGGSAEKGLGDIMKMMKKVNLHFEKLNGLEWGSSNY